MKQNRTVKVYEEEYDDLPEKADEFIAFFQSKVDAIPEENRGTARIEIEAEENYGSASLSVEISYARPETDEEEAARERREQLRKDEIKTRDLRELARLKEKLGV